MRMEMDNKWFIVYFRDVNIGLTKFLNFVYKLQEVIVAVS